MSPLEFSPNGADGRPDEQVADLLERAQAEIPYPADDPATRERWICEVLCRYGHEEGLAGSGAPVAPRPPVPAPAAPQSIVCREGGGKSAVMAGFLAFLRFWHRVVREHVAHRVSVRLRELRDQFQAHSIWLFVKEADDLVARFTQNAAGLDLRLRIDGRDGIVTWVARHNRGYHSPDVNRDPYYFRVNPETSSALAAPLHWGDRCTEETLLGVVHLESVQAGAFTAAQVGELQAAAGDLTIQLLVLRALLEQPRPCPWHPELHGWDLVRLSQSLCQHVAHALDANRTECTLWYADHAKEHLFVYGGTGYDDEYRHGRTLPFDSSTGRAAQLPPGGVHCGTPDDDEFVRKEKARSMGLRQFQIVPVYRGGSGKRRPAIAALSFYHFEERAADTLPSGEELGRLAHRVGRLINSYDAQRQRLALCFLEHALAERPRDSEDDFETTKKVLLDVFQADGCHIFARHPERTELWCVATTGLVKADARWTQTPAERVSAPRLARRIVYPLRDDPEDLVTYLAARGTCVRKNDVPDPDERGVPADLPGLVREPYLDPFARSTTDHRRYLGAGVPAEDGGPSAGAVGVVLLVRADRTKPFTRCDQALLRRLAPQFRTAIHRWQKLVATPAPAQLASEPSTARPARRRVADAVHRFFWTGGVNESNSPRRLLQDVLQDLYAFYRDQGIRRASLVLRYKANPTQPFRVYCAHSDKRLTVPIDADALRPPLDWASVLAQRSVVTFNLRAAAARRGGKVLAGIRVPFLVWGLDLTEGILSLDFMRPVSWNSHDVDLAGAASRKLAEILARQTELRPDEDLRTTLAHLCGLPGRYVAADWAAVGLEERGQARFLLGGLPAHLRGVGDNCWEPLDKDLDEDASSLGVRELRGRGAWSVPVHLGPLQAGRVLFGFHDGGPPRRWTAFGQEGRDLLGHISSGVARSTSLGRSACAVEFRQADVAAGGGRSGVHETARVGYWSGELAWPAEALAAAAEAAG